MPDMLHKKELPLPPPPPQLDRSIMMEKTARDRMMNKDPDVPVDNPPHI
jgi:hypothetical protein